MSTELTQWGVESKSTASTNDVMPSSSYRNLQQETVLSSGSSLNLHIDYLDMYAFVF